MATALALLVALWADRPVAGAEPQPLTVTRQAYVTYPGTDALPPVLVDEVPPGPVCIVAPPFCGPESAPLEETAGVEDGVPVPETPDHELPQPVLPGSLPVGLLGGTTRYTSTLLFELPELPADGGVATFQLVLHEVPPTFAVSSPAFRAVVLALLEQFNGPNEAAVERLLDELAKGEAPPVAVESLGVEACAVTAEWEAGESQSPEAAPPVDCIFGATGIRAASGAWTFDLSLMAQAWADGSMPFHGIALRPLGPPNLAYGDPDLSTTSQIAFAGADSAAGEPPQLVVELGRGGGDDTAFAPADTGGAPFTDVASGSLGPSFVPQGATDVAPPPVAAPTAGAPAPAGRSDPRTPWYVWVTIPLGLAGLAVFHQGMTAGAFGAGAVLRPGALARLVGGGRAGPGAAA